MPTTTYYRSMIPRNISEARHRQMRAYTEDVISELALMKELALNISGFTCSRYLEKIFQILDKRLIENRKSLRIFFAREIAQYIMRKEKEYCPIEAKDLFEKKIPFILEVIIVIQYIQNQIYDGKGQVIRSNSDKIRENVILADKLKDILYSYIDSIEGISLSKKLLISSYVRKIFSMVCDGQWLEKEYINHFKKQKDIGKSSRFNEYNSCLNTHGFMPEEIANHLKTYKRIISGIKKNFDSDKSELIDIYFYRIFLTNSALFIYGVELICKLLKASDKLTKKLNKFVCGYSLALQITNDNSDFIYKILDKEGCLSYLVAKEQKDAMSDLKNQNATLPILLHLQYISGKEKKSWVWSIMNSQVDKQEFKMYPVLILKELIESKALQSSIKASRKITKRSIEYLDTTILEGKLLEDMAGIGNWNKFYYSAEKFEKRINDDKFFRKEMLYTIICHIEKGKIRNTSCKSSRISTNQLSLFEENSPQKDPINAPVLASV